MNLAKSLAEARASAEEEARLRETGESMWTAERLRVSIQSRPFGSLFVVSNREPYMHVHRGKNIEVARAGERPGHRARADSSRLRRHLDRVWLGRCG